MKEIKIKSNFDGLVLHTLILEPKKRAKGIVQISHGMAEHKERYLPFMKFLNSEGYIAVIHDHRGHGKSIKSKEDYGYFYDSTGDAIVEDLYQITLFVKEKYPDLPLTLFGHSMGSMVARKYIKKYDKEIDKLIVCGAPSENPKVGLALNLVHFLIRLKKDHYRSKLIDHLVFGNYNKKFKQEESRNAWLCSDFNVVSEYEKDKACGFLFTLNGFLNLFLLMRDIYEAEGYLVRNYELPILFIAGTDDPVIISRFEWEASQIFLKNVGYENVKGILYKNMRHEILNEKEKEKVFWDILDFLKS